MRLITTFPMVAIVSHFGSRLARHCSWILLLIIAAASSHAGSCDPVPSGIVAWWPGEGNGNDIISGNTATLQSSVSFAPGEVGQAFVMNSFGAYLSAPTSATLNVGTNNSGLTVEAWINLTSVAGFHPLAEWNDGLGDLGCHMWLGSTPSDVGVLFANLIDTSGNGHAVISPQNAVEANVFQHVAVTYDQSSGVATLYVNGAIVAQAAVGSFVPQTSYTFWIGVRAGDTPGDSTYGSFLGGELDEMTIYKRALAQSEINAIYQAGSGGKCSTPMPPIITIQPTNQTAVIGSAPTFTVSATGTPPLNYQWSFDGTNIANGTNATLTLTNVQINQTGNYTVVVTNLYGSTNSAVAVLAVYGLPPAIVTQPTNQSVAVGSTATFSVTANGTSPLIYQWNFNGTNIANATNATLTLENVQLNQSGNYAVSITNFFGSTNSGVALLTVYPAPPCDPEPSGIVAWWRAEGNALDSVGGNNGTLMNGTGFTNGEVGLAFNLNGINNFVLANPAAPTNLDVAQGSGLTIEGWIKPAAISSSPMMLVQYERVLGGSGSDVGLQFNMNNIPNSGSYPGCLAVNLVDTTGAIHVFGTAANLLTAGVWQHIALTYDKTSGVGVLYANGVRAAQANLGVFTPQTSYTNVLLGATTDYASPASPGNVFSGQMDEISLYNRALSSNEVASIYQIGNGGKCFTPTPPSITTPPTNQTAVVGSTVTFSITAAGTPLLNYQWSFNGTNIASATNATLMLTNMQIDESGNYSVLVSNPYGSTNSAVAILTVYGLPPFITARPTNQTSLVDGAAIFSVSAGGTPPLCYQWQFNGTNLLAATNSTLVLTNLSLNESGNYDVVVTNYFGSITSSPAILNVLFIEVEVNGQIATGTATAISPATITILGGYPGGYLFYTLDGSAPSSSSTLYTGPFVLTNSAIVSTFGQSSDFSQQGAGVPITVQVIPAYALQTSIVGSGTLSTNPPGGVYASNTVVTLTATPALHWSFAYWAGDTNGTQMPLNVTMNAPRNIQAVFVQSAFPLTLTTPGGGNVTANGVFIGGPTYYPAGAVVNLFATPLSGWSFLRWQGTINKTNNPYSLVINQTNVIQGIFGTVAATNSVGGAIILSPTNPIPYGSSLAVSAVPNPGNYFASWNGTLSGTISPARITVTSPVLNLGAYFSALPTNKYALNAVVNGNGFVTLSPPSSYYSPGSSVTLTASANPGSYFFGWSGAATGTSNPLTVQVTNNEVIQANFGVGPAVSISPLNLTVFAGTNATLSASVLGLSPLFYQWQNSLGPIVGATNVSFVISNIQPASAGGYSVVVSNSFGIATSSVATITVVGAPSITNEPVSVTVIVGHSASFGVGAVGAPVLAYQWLLNGGNLARATNSTLAMTNVFPGNAGNYTVAISNLYGSVTSTAAPLTVLPLNVVIPGKLVAGQFQITFDTAVGINYQVQYSIDMINWSPWLTLGGIGQPLTLTDPAVGNNQQRFYRIALVP